MGCQNSTVDTPLDQPPIPKPLVNPPKPVEKKDQLTIFREKCLENLNKEFQENTQFDDVDFPPRDTSLGEFSIKTKEAFSKVEWLRPQEFLNVPLESIKLYDNIEPNDIQEGYIEKNYDMSNFFASISALAEFPERVKKLIVNTEVSCYGQYHVIFFVNGQPIVVVIDDRFPCVDKVPIFTKPNGNEIWCLIIEKAWAKLHKSYTNMQLQPTDVIMSYLTGNHCETFSKSNNEEYFQGEIKQNQGIQQISQPEYQNLPEKLIELIQYVDKNNGIMVAKTYSLYKLEEKKVKFMIPNFYYTVIGIYKLGDVHLLKLRNPWGNFEYMGEYCETNPIWTNNEYKKIVDYQAKNDGVFYMSLQEFLNAFNEIVVNHYNEHAHYQYYNIESNSIKAESFYFQVNNTQECLANLRIHQPSKILEQICYPYFEQQKYSPIEYLLINKDTKIEANGDKFRFFGKTEIALADANPFLQLLPGEHLIKVKFQTPVKNFTLSVEATEILEIKNLPKNEGRIKFQEHVLTYCDQLTQQKNWQLALQQFQNATVKRFKFSDDEYFVAENIGSKDITVKIKFSKINGYRIYKENRASEQEIEFKLEPKQKKVARMTLINKCQQPFDEYKIDIIEE